MIAIKSINSSFPLDSNKCLGSLMVCHYGLCEHALPHKGPWHPVPSAPVSLVSHNHSRTAKDSILFIVHLKAEKFSS